MRMLRVMACLMGVGALIFLSSARAYPQFEVSPDHFDGTDAQPSQPAKTMGATRNAKIHYQGHVTLPYSLRCNGKNLPPGKYALSLTSDGKTAELSLNRQGEDVRLEGTAQQQAGRREADALVVKRSGKVHQLSAVHVAQLEMVFSSVAEHERREVERLPVQWMQR